ncbi:lipoprotein [Listeria riparia]
MRKIVIAILSLMVLSGCSLFSDAEKEMKQTICCWFLIRGSLSK